MSEYFIHNGEVIDALSNASLDNRAFRYGDGLFETIRVINGAPVNLAVHWSRLLKGAEIIGLKIPSYFNEDFIKTEILKLLNYNQIEKGGKVRLHIYPAGKGTYKRETHSISFFISAEHLSNNLFLLNTEGKNLDIYLDIKKSKNLLSNLKTSNGLMYVMAANYAQEHNLHDVFMLNTENNIIETSSSNIFIVSNGVLYTPPLADGCVGGTMRMKIINIAIKNNIKIYESSIKPQNLMVADEILLTNSVSGVQWVGAYKGKRYFNDLAKKIVSLLNSEYTSLKLDLQENLKSL